MSAKLIFDHAPIGAIIAYSDGTPRPPDRHRRKLADWKNRNGAGRLICKRAAVERGAHAIPASFTLHEGDFGSNGTIVMRVHKTFDVNSPREFTVREQPKAGSVLVMSRPGDLGELVHLAQTAATPKTGSPGTAIPKPCCRRSRRRRRIPGGQRECLRENNPALPDGSSAPPDEGASRTDRTPDIGKGGTHDHDRQGESPKTSPWWIALDTV